MAELKGMPLLIINMGGEMLYILDQRLSAQSIAADKSVRVLQDVVSTMFSEKFVKELFKPQKMYTNESTRQIFDRLAHSSIMRLNESSMSKLYDLMFMATKYQLLSASSADELAQITLNHLDAVRKFIKGEDVLALIDNAIRSTISLFTDMTLGDFNRLRQTLCRFFQDRKIKVSLFLHDGIQQSDGAIIISAKGSLPPGSKKPGTVTFYDYEGAESKTETLQQTNATDTKPANKPFCVKSPSNNRYSKLGTNLFAKDRRKQGANKPAARNRNVPEADRDFVVDETAGKAAKAELNSLASILGAACAAVEKNTFTLSSLFPAAADDAKGGGGRSGNVITFDDNDAKTYADELASGVGSLNIENKDDDDDDDGGADDLLSLMDCAVDMDKDQVFSGGALGPSYKR